MATKTWQDRVRQGAVTSPDNERILFDFEDVQRTTPLRSAPFAFAGVDNEYVQQNGYGSRKYPLRCYFSGAQCDMLATAFEAILVKRGIFRLEHPLYGTFDVVPFGDISRNDSLKTAANQAIVEVTFWTTTGAVYPSSATDAQDEIFAAIAGFDFATAQYFANSITLANATHKASLTGGIRKMLGKISGALSGISRGVNSINKQFREVQSTVNFGMDVLIGQPLLLAQQVSNLIKAPARAWGGIGSRMDAYGQLEQSIFGSKEGNPAREILGISTSSIRRGKVANDFHASDLVAMNAVVGSVVVTSIDPIGAPSGTKGAGFTTRPQALLAADVLAAQFDELMRWRDEGFAALGALDGLENYQVDTGEAYQALQRCVALALGNLIQLSFSLLPERSIILDRPRTILDLCAELYQSIDDDKLNFLIDSNNLSGSQILELQRDTKIFYYAA